MPADTIGEVLGSVFRLIGRFLFEVLFEFVIRGAGTLVCRPFGRRVDPEGVLVVMVGLAFWIVVAIFMVRLLR